MKIIEALKELRLIDKKIDRNHTNIEKYSSMVSTELPAFNTLEEQRLKVASMVQETRDFVYRKIELKARIAYTNLMTYVTIGGRKWSLQNLLDFQRGSLSSIRGAYESLSDHAGQVRLRNAVSLEGRVPQVVRLYDENSKLTELDFWDTLKEDISARLEVINAVTDLLELPTTPE